MMRKKHIYLAQISTQYGASLFLPYSVGCVWSYAQTIPEITAAYDFKGFLVGRESIPDVIERLDQPLVLGLSCYIWNWRYSLALAKAVKDAYPECLIVMGGPQIPDASSTFAFDYPFVDLLVHGEGELTFADILVERLQGQPQYEKIPGLTVLRPPYIMTRTPSRERLSDLSILPSPYLAGLFDELMQEDYDFCPVFECSRGCPYSCNFCAWGSATQQKTKIFPMDRLEAEITWFAQHRIRFLTNADANFGIMPRDVAICHALAQAKAEYGYPKEMHATYAKNATERVFAIAKILNDAAMCKGVTMSFQSLDAHTLQAVKRSNIKIDRFQEHLTQYQASGIPTYSELILGLPGETLDSFKDGINTLLEAGQHQGITIYLCRMLPNTEMNEPKYRQEYGIQTIQSQSAAQHSVPSMDDIMEYDELVIGTTAMPTEDWQHAFMFSWAVQTFHCMGLSRLVAMYLHQEHEVSYRQFYEGLVRVALGQPWTMIGQEYESTRQVMLGALKGEAWDIQIPAYGPTIWPTEEASFLRLVLHKAELIAELRDIIDLLGATHGFPDNASVVDDLLRFQSFVLRDPYLPKLLHVESDYHWPAYFAALQAGTPAPVELGPFLIDLEAEASYNGDLPEYAKSAVWYGRKSGEFYYTPKG